MFKLRFSIEDSKVSKISFHKECDFRQKKVNFMLKILQKKSMTRFCTKTFYFFIFQGACTNNFRKASTFLKIAFFSKFQNFIYSSIKKFTSSVCTSLDKSETATFS
jgi:hypothetical protein